MSTDIIIHNKKADESEDSQIKALPYDLSYIPDKLLKRAKTELFEDEETRVNSLKLLRSMLKEEAEKNNLYYYDDDTWLLAFLRARKFDVNRSFKMVKTYYTVKNKHEEIFGRYEENKFISALEKNVVGVLPYRDDDGRVILVLKIGNWNPHKLPWGQYTQTLTGLLLHGIRSASTQIAGFHVIVDVKGVTLSQLPHITPKYLWLICEALQNCFPARFKGVHFINESPLISPVWAVMRSFLTKKLADRFYFHGKDLKKFHTIFSPSILPSNVGKGKLPPFNNDEYIEKVKKCADYFALLCTHGYRQNNNLN